MRHTIKNYEIPAASARLRSALVAGVSLLGADTIWLSDAQGFSSSCGAAILGNATPSVSHFHTLATQPSTLTATPDNAVPHQITGVLREIKGSTLTIETRKGATVLIDKTVAVKTQQVGVIAIGMAITIQGSYGPNGSLLATAIMRAKHSSELWLPDR